MFLTLVRLDGRGVNGTDSAMESTLAGMMDSILFAGHGRELHFTDDAGNIIIVASLEKHDGLEDALRFMKGMAEPFQTSVNRATGYTVSLFFGSIVRVDLAHAEYLRLLEQSRTRFVGEPGVIMVPESSSADVVGSRAGVQGSRTHRLVEQVRSYVEQNINKEITVADIAAYLHLHPNYLLRLFKEETGEAIIEFLIHARIQKAKELLVDSQMKIYEVAEYVGYDSVSHFSRIFKRETGISPKVFQQQR